MFMILSVMLPIKYALPMLHMLPIKYIYNAVYDAVYNAVYNTIYNAAYNAVYNAYSVYKACL